MQRVTVTEATNKHGLYVGILLTYGSDPTVPPVLPLSAPSEEQVQPP